MFKVHLISMYLAITYLIVSPKWPIKISPSVLVKVLEAFPWPLALVVSSKQFNLKSNHRTGPRMIIGESFPPTKTSTGPQILRQTPPPICFNRCWLTDFPDDLAVMANQSDPNQVPRNVPTWHRSWSVLESSHGTAPSSRLPVHSVDFIKRVEIETTNVF